MSTIFRYLCHKDIVTKFYTNVIDKGYSTQLQEVGVHIHFVPHK